MPLTVRNFARAALLVVGCAVAALLGLVAVSRSDAAPAWSVAVRSCADAAGRSVPASVLRDRLHSPSRDETRPLMIVR